jgi:hypothetical protein
VVVAPNRKEARRLVDAALDKHGLLVGEEKKYDLEELDIYSPPAILFSNY